MAVMDETGLAKKLDVITQRHPTVGLAVVVAGPGGGLLFRGHGVADHASGTPITEETGFRIASISKTFTAIAVMQLVESGLVRLDRPANDYLRAFRLVPARAGHRAATVRDLLTHTAGLGELAHLSGLIRPDFGESVPAGTPLPSLAQFYGGRLHLKAEPGTCFTYGNQGPAVLGQLVEDVVGAPLDVVFRERLFEPLGMHHSDLLRSEQVRARLASGYEPRSDGWRAVEERDMITAGAASVYSTPADMARYMSALLGGGANEHGRVLQPDTLAQMFAPQYRPDPRIPGMGLGFFRAEVSGHAVVEHQGVHPGFHSHLCLAPEKGVGVVVLTNGAQDPMFWLSTEAHDLLGSAIGVEPATETADMAISPSEVAELVGWYRLDGPWSDLRKRVFMGAGAEVFERDGRLMLRFLTLIQDLYRGFPLLPDQAPHPDVYRVDLDEAGTSRVVFTRAPDGSVDSIVLGMMPIEMRRQPRRTNPRLWAAGAMAIAAAGVAAAGFVLRRTGPR